MNGQGPKVYIGFIVFGEQTAKYLPPFLDSLKKQTFSNIKILAYNNGDDGAGNSFFIKRSGIELTVMGDGKNVGFAAAYNLMIKEAVKEKADYFWVTNPDMVYNSDTLERLVSRMEGDAELGSVCPKLLKWEFGKDHRTDIVDSCGIEMKDGLRFFDFGQGERDRFDLRYGSIIGPSGASGLYRLAALEKVKEDGDYFDENFFMYKEDCDLDYRLMLAEWETALVPEAVGWHDRTAVGAGKNDVASIKARIGKSQKVRVWSTTNQFRIFLKYWKLQKFKSKLAIIAYSAKVLVYSLIFERSLLKELLAVWKGRNVLSRYG